MLRVKVTVVAVGVFVLGASVTSVAEAKTSCAYAGAPANVLTVKVSGVGIGVIERKGLEITASEYLESPETCAGGMPTVLNTDSIVVRVADFSFVEVKLRGGPFAPGVTAESEGASEIEISIVGSGDGEVIGSRAADAFEWGPGGDYAGLNVNARSNGDQDVDVTVSGEDAFLLANGAAGNDTIVTQPGAVIRDSVYSVGGSGDDLLQAPDGGGGILEGNSGNDVIIGSKNRDLLNGGSGNDRVSGRAGADEISGGRGKDRLSGGAGRDNINARDARRETVSCGTGRDRVKADRRDRVRGCETRR